MKLFTHKTLGSSFRLVENAGAVIPSRKVGWERSRRVPASVIHARKVEEAALEKLGAQASSSLYVGDMYAVDVLGARAAGLEAVLFDPLGAWNGAGCVVLRDLRELVKMLRNR